MAPNSSFRPDRLRRLAEIEDRHFWFRGRWALVERLLERFPLEHTGRVLDAGCGTGNTLRLLRERSGTEAVGLDRRPEGLRRQEGAAEAAFFVQGDATTLPFGNETFSTVFMLDVLEHVDDGSALREVRRVLQPGGVLILTVPAIPELWSYRDSDAGHLRRYTRRSLREAVSGAMLEPEDMRYYQFLLFPLVALSRWLGGRGPAVRNMEDLPHPAVNALFTAVNRLEVRWGETLKWPWGSTLAAVCRKPPTS